MNISPSYPLNIPTKTRTRTKTVFETVEKPPVWISFFEGSARLGLAALPPLVKSSRAASQSLYDNSFAVVGPKLWNILPASIKNEDIITSFKASVYSFFSRYPDTPPLRGKPAPQNGNSLLDWA